jgi:transcriptional regulator with XRE-family HTH domain
MADAQTPWLALRVASGLSQREVERRLGWQKRGHLSLIERGVQPNAAQDQQLREFYGALLTARPKEIA